MPYLLDEQAACAAGAAALSAAGCRRWGGPPLPGPASTSEWPPLAAELARVPRPGGFGERNNLLNDSQLKATGVNGVGEMQHGAPAYSQPKALELHTEAAPMIDGMVQNTVSEVDVHSIVKFNCEALPCDLREPTASGERFHTDEEPHTGVVRIIGGTVLNTVPEDLVRNIAHFNCEALPCDLREPISRDEGLHTGVVRIIGGTVQNKEPEDKEPEAAGHTQSSAAEELNRKLSQGRSMDAVIRQVRRDMEELGRVYSGIESRLQSDIQEMIRSNKKELNSSSDIGNAICICNVIRKLSRVRSDIKELEKARSSLAVETASQVTVATAEGVQGVVLGGWPPPSLVAVVI